MLSVNTDNFTSSFLIWLSIPFSCLLVLPRASNIIFTRSGEYVVSCGFFLYGFYHSEFLSISHSLSVLCVCVWKDVEFYHSFIASIEMIWVFFPSFYLLPIFNFFLILSYMRCLYILEINPLSVALFANILYHSVGYLFILLMIPFTMQKLLSLIRSHVLIFVFIFITLGGRSKNDIVVIYVGEFSTYVFL